MTDAEMLELYLSSKRNAKMSQTKELEEELEKKEDTIARLIKKNLGLVRQLEEAHKVTSATPQTKELEEELKATKAKLAGLQDSLQYYKNKAEHQSYMRVLEEDKVEALVSTAERNKEIICELNAQVLDMTSKLMRKSLPELVTEEKIKVLEKELAASQQKVESQQAEIKLLNISTSKLRASLDITYRELDKIRELAKWYNKEETAS